MLGSSFTPRQTGALLSKVFVSLFVLTLVLPFNLSAHEDKYTGISERFKGGISDLWQQVRQEEGNMQQMINEKKLDQVPKSAYKIRDLSMAFYEKASGVSRMNRKTLHAAIDKIDEISKNLAKSSKENDLTKTQEQFEQLTQALQTIGKQPV